MAIDRDDIEKIIAGVVGVGIVGLGVAALIETIVDGGDPYVPDYHSPNNNRNDDDYDDYEEYNDIPTEDEIFEQERIQREMDSMRYENQADEMWEQYSNGAFQGGYSQRNYDSVKEEFEEKNDSYQTSYIYLDFTENMKSGSRNRDDIYQESIENQFEKIQRKLSLYGKSGISDISKFMSICFPMMKSIYYVSLPSFDRTISRNPKLYWNSESIHNMVLRPEKTGIISSVIPAELDLILVGDLVFGGRDGGLISFVVKGIDLIDQNVEKFGEVPIECAAACATTRNDRNLPDYHIGGRDLYKSFLTRDMVLSLCEKVYPIENPEKAVAVFAKWQKYIKFRKYYLGVQSQRNEVVEHADIICVYAVSKNEYKKNESEYAQYLLDGNQNFAKKKDPIYLDTEIEDAVEVLLVRIEISRNLAEINKNMTKKGNISIFERDLRRLTKGQVMLTQNDPGEGEGNLAKGGIVYLGDRVEFSAVDIEPDCEDVIQFFDKKISKGCKQIDNKYEAIVKATIDAYREKKEEELAETSQKELSKYKNMLLRNLEAEVEANSDKTIQRRYNHKKKEIQAKYEKQRRQIEKQRKSKIKDKKNLDAENQFEYQIAEINTQERQEIESIPLKAWYEERNEEMIVDFEKHQILQKSKALDTVCREKEELLRLELSETIEAEKKVFRNECEKEKQTEIKKKQESLTQRRFVIYFKADEVEQGLLNTKDLTKYQYLAYNSRIEKAKIDRQEKTISSFYKGYVKNPFLASYLFVPESLGGAENVREEIEWYGDRLNDSQKEAVRRALSSNSLFLLQGPPGTGKTEVISEITAQYVKQGKKVLVSSETHKAIDNVFDRLPKIPEIRPLRLIPSRTNKDSEYSPEKLVDNLYESISNRLDSRIQRYENFAEMKNSFHGKMEELRYRQTELQKLEASCKSIQDNKNMFQKEIESIDAKVEEQRKSIRPLKEELEQYNGVLRYIDNGVFDEESEKEDILRKIESEIFNILSGYDFFMDLDSARIRNIYRISLEQIQEEFKTIQDNSSSMSVEQEKAKIRAQINATIDPDTYDVIEGKEEENARLRKQLIALKNEKREESSIDFNSLSVAEVFAQDKLIDSVSRTKIIQSMTEIKNRISSYVEEEKTIINDFIVGLSAQIDAIEVKIRGFKDRKSTVLDSIERLNEDNSYVVFRRKQQELRKEITDFFEDFEITDEYQADDYLTAIRIVEKKWGEIEQNQQALEAENKSKIPMYKAICKYLSDDEILEEDRISYTKKIFDNANVFGLTCTSRDYFNESSMAAMREFKLGAINVKSVGIDVVIIDEVSKSSFLDLMIPILYGKTVILVGDHRQLPPMYDLKHMRRDDFDGLDHSIIDYNLNKEYRELYETCFFKDLFERVPNAYKIMLDKQYRCHSDIMDVFNHFYSTNGKGLSVGLANQNDLKHHDLLIKRNGMTLIEPDKHVYFVNCTEYESTLDQDSTSLVNRQEADVVCNLLRFMNEEYGDMLDSGRLRKNQKKDERKSVGVICTYRDQARLIWKNLKGVNLKNFSQQREEKLIINTVDDFQGDERDIIIVSMVRNPGRKSYNTDFIDQFERINVALSRARCMLIVVGSQEFLSRSSIELPDINGNTALDRHSFPVYREIIRTIQAKGKLLQASDVIGEVKRNGRK